MMAPPRRRGSPSAAALVVLVMLALALGSDAQSASTSSSSRCPSGTYATTDASRLGGGFVSCASTCAKKTPGCARCAGDDSSKKGASSGGVSANHKGSGGSSGAKCSACAAGAQLTAAGACACPPGSGPPGLGGTAFSGAGASATHKKGGDKSGAAANLTVVVMPACAKCKADFASPGGGSAAAACTRCFAGTGTNNLTGQSECLGLDVNTPPRTVADAYTVARGATLVIKAAQGVMGNDFDVQDPHPKLTIALTAPPTLRGVAVGKLTMSPDGAFTYVAPATMGVGEVINFSYKVTDTGGLSATGVATIKIAAATCATSAPRSCANGVVPHAAKVTCPTLSGSGLCPAALCCSPAPNTGPTAVDDAYTAVRGQRLILSAPGVLGNDADTQDALALLKVTLITGPPELVLDVDGGFSYQAPNSLTPGDVVRARYTVTDTGGKTASANVLITVLPATCASSPPASPGCPNGVVSNAGTVVCDALDAAGLCDRALCCSAAPNTPPSAVNDAYTVKRGKILNVAANSGVLANDADAQDSRVQLAAVLVGAPTVGSLSLLGDGGFSYTHPPTTPVGTIARFAYMAKDSGALTSPVATATITIIDTDCVASPPLPLSTCFYGLRSDAANVRCPTLDAQAACLPTLCCATDARGGWQPGLDYSGGSGSGGTGGTSGGGGGGIGGGGGGGGGGAVSTPPTATNDAYTVASGSTLTVGTAATSVRANDFNPNGLITALTVSQVAGPAVGTLTLAADGTFTYVAPGTLAAGAVVTFSYKVTDAGGLASTPATVSITIAAPGATPPSAVDDAFQVALGATLTAAAASSVLNNDLNSNGQLATGLSAQIVSQPTPGGVTITLAAAGTFTYTPPNTLTAGTVVTFTYKSLDTSTNLLSAAATVSITILAAGTVPPTAVADSYIVSSGGTLTVGTAATGVRANDINPNGAISALTVSLVAPPAVGTLTLAADGTFTYVAPGAPPSVVTFTYKVLDTTTNLLSAPATVSIATATCANSAPTCGANGVVSSPGSVACSALSALGKCDVAVCCKPNLIPVALDDAYQVVSGATLTTTPARGVLANDADFDSTPGGLTTLRVAGPFASAGSVNGALTLGTDGAFTYVAASGGVNVPVGATVAFVYTAYDAAGGSSTAQVVITVISAAAAGTSTTPDLFVSSTGSNTYTVPAPGLVGNDPASSGVINPLTVTTTPSSGTVTAASDGSFTYTPTTPPVTGTLHDTFTYTVTNPSGTSPPTLVTILGDQPAIDPITSVLTPPVTTAPIPSDDDYDAVVGTAITVDVCANDQDGAPAMSNAQSFSILLTQAPTAGTLSPANPTSCSFTYTPGAAPGLDRLRYKLVSPTTAGISAITAVVTFRVASAPPPRVPRDSNSNGGPQPTVVVAVDDTYSVVKQGSLSVPASQGVLANDRLPTGVTVTAVTLSGSLSVVGVGSIGSATFSLGGATDGSFSFSPDSADATSTAKTYKQSYTITGSDGSTSTAADILISAKPQPVAAVPNQRPVAVDDAFTFQVGGAATTFATSLLANDYDPDSTVGSLTVVTGAPFTLTPSGAGTVSVTSAGALTFTPTNPTAGTTVSFTYSIKDGANLQSTGTATVRIKFTAAPTSGSVTTNTGVLVVPRDDVYSFDTAASSATFTGTGNGVLGNDGLATGVTVTSVAAVNVGACAPVCKGSPAIAASGVTLSFSNTDKGQFTLTTGSGNNDEVYTFYYAITATDSANAAVSAAAISPAYAKVTVNAVKTGNSIKALPAEDIYYVTASASPTTVSGTVEDWAKNDGYEKPGGQVTQVTWPLPFAAQSVSVNAVAAVGSYSQTTPSASFTSAFAFTVPANTAVGTTATVFTYKLTASNVVSALTNVKFVVVAALGSSTTSVATVPVAQAADDAYSITLPAASLTVSVADGLLKNDGPTTGGTRVASIVGNPAVTVTPAGGSTVLTNSVLTLAADGSFVFTPPSGYAAGTTYAITYRLTYTPTGGGSAVTDTAVLRVSALAALPTAAPLPDANDDTYTVTNGFTLNVPAATGVLRNDIAPPSTTLRVQANSLTPVGTSRGSMALNSDGSFTFTPAAGLSGFPLTATYSYLPETTASPPAVAPVAATITITIAALPTQPDGAFGSATCPAPGSDPSCDPGSTSPTSACVIQSGTRKGQAGTCFGGCCVSDGTCKSSSCVASGLGTQQVLCNSQSCTCTGCDTSVNPAANIDLVCKVYVPSCYSTKDRKCIGVTTCSHNHDLTVCRAALASNPTLQGYVGKTCLEAGSNRSPDAQGLLTVNWKVCTVGCSLTTPAPYPF